MRAPVKVTLNGGYSFRSTIAAMGGPPCIPLRRSHREAAGLAGGETIEIRVELDTEARVVTRPSVETDHFMRDCRTKGETPLRRAAAFGSDATVGMLLDAGARLDALDMNGDSPLSWASWYTRPRSIIRMLCYGGFHANQGLRPTAYGLWPTACRPQAAGCRLQPGLAGLEVRR